LNVTSKRAEEPLGKMGFNLNQLYTFSIQPVKDDGRKVIDSWKIAEKAVGEYLRNLSLGQFQISLLACLQKSEIVIKLQLSCQLFNSWQNFALHVITLRWANVCYLLKTKVLNL
jgi:hypothetical protein